MAVRVVLGNPYYANGECVVGTNFEAELAEHLNNYEAEKLEFTVERTNHGVGFDAITATVTITGFLLFGIPAAHKKIRESLAEWKIIYSNAHKVIEYLNRKQPVEAYSQEIAFLEALAYLECKANVQELEVLEVTQLAGVKGKNVADDFAGALILYYVFMFRDEGERLIILVYDSKLNRVDQKALSLDPRFPLADNELI